MVPLSHRALSAAAVAASVFACVPVVQGDDPDLDRLAELAAERRARFDSLRVTFTSSLAEGATPGLADMTETTLVVEGDRWLRTTHRVGGAAADEPWTHDRWTSWNGEDFCLYNTYLDGRAFGMAAISSEPVEPFDVQGLEFFDANMLGIAAEADPERAGQDQTLLSLLLSERATLRPDPEVIGDRVCHVVDLVDRDHARTVLTVWLDDSDGIVPVRQVFHHVAGDDPLIEFNAERIETIASGLPLVTAGTKRVASVPCTLDGAHVWQFETARLADDVADVTVGADFDDGLFSAWTMVPAGTPVGRVETQETWIAQADDLRDIAEPYLAAVPPSEALPASPLSRMPARAGATAAGTMLPDARIGLLAGASALACCIVVAFRSRRTDDEAAA